MGFNRTSYTSVEVEGEKFVHQCTASVTPSMASQMKRIREEFDITEAEALRMILSWGLEYYLFAKYVDWDAK